MAVTAKRVVGAATIAVGAAFAYIVAHDGSPLWQIARLLLVCGVSWLAYGAIARGRAGARSGVMFAEGCVAVAVGIGIGLPHLAKTGLGLMTAAGLVALVAGLVLVGAGATGLVRATPRWPRLLVVPAQLVVVLLVVWSLGQATAATNVARSALGSITPGDVGLGYRDVEFDTTDGVTLSAWYVPSTNTAAVVLLHGAGSTRSNVLDHAVVLAKHGYGVAMVDARGHGRSEGRAMDFGWYGDRDVAAAVSFLTAQPDVDPSRIAAVGMSMGGEEAIGAAASDIRIRAVVAEGATNRVTADKAWLSDEYGWRGTLQRGVEWILYNTADAFTAAGPPIALRDAAAAPRPMLLVAAGDEADEAEADRYIQTGSPESVEVWVVPGTHHTAAIRTYPLEWERRVTAFLSSALNVANDLGP
ncbi:MAG: alpha/beta fold hydrolase [Acidimicrobiales bacterium]